MAISWNTLCSLCFPSCRRPICQGSWWMSSGRRGALAEFLSEERGYGAAWTQGPARPSEQTRESRHSRDASVPSCRSARCGGGASIQLVVVFLGWTHQGLVTRNILHQSYPVTQGESGSVPSQVPGGVVGQRETVGVCVGCSPGSMPVQFSKERQEEGWRCSNYPQKLRIVDEHYQIQVL